MDNIQQSPLLGLPAELRNIIYHMAFIPKERIELNTKSKKWSGIPLQLLHVCQQIRTEAHGIFWSESKFQLTSVDWNKLPKDDCLQKIGRKNARLIQDIALKVFDDRDSILQLIAFGAKAHLMVRGLVLGHRLHIREEARYLLYCGISESSVKLVSPILANCSLEHLERAQEWIDKQLVSENGNGRTLWSPWPKLRWSESGSRNLRIGGIQVSITDADTAVGNVASRYLRTLPNQAEWFEVYRGGRVRCEAF